MTWGRRCRTPWRSPKSELDEVVPGVAASHAWDFTLDVFLAYHVPMAGLTNDPTSIWEEYRAVVVNDCAAFLANSGRKRTTCLMLDNFDLDRPTLADWRRDRCAAAPMVVAVVRTVQGMRRLSSPTTCNSVHQRPDRRSA